LLVEQPRPVHLNASRPIGLGASVVPRARLNALYEAFSEALVDVEIARGEGDADAPDEQTWAFAWGALSQLLTGLDVPLPLVIPAPTGGLGAEWHAAGLDIELRFRAPGRIYCAVEDGRSVISRASDFRSDLRGIGPAVRELAARLKQAASAG
jgi:hypothetical protein